MAIGDQLRHPRGLAGLAAGHLMRFANAQPYRLAIAALDLQPIDSVLELGCGPGEGLRLAAARLGGGAIHGIDHSAVMLAQARSRNRDAIHTSRIHLYRAPFEQLPFATASFDKVLAVNVAYFWRDAKAVLREVRRVLRPGGAVSIYVTSAATMRRWAFAETATHRLFDRDSLAHALRSGGFASDCITIAHVQVAPRIDGLIATIRPGI